MPPPLPDRYRLELRLGRDFDAEEWLATDLLLDRPVLLRIVGPESSKQRRTEFLNSVRAAAAVPHLHLAAVYSAEELPDAAMSVSEWVGGATLADRLAGGETMTVEDFLANAAGLADGLAALHASGETHGAIDPAAIRYAVGSPAKLAAFGRPHLAASAGSDVLAFTETLRTGLTGLVDAPPSEVIDGIHPRLDRILAAAAAGTVSARGLAEALNALPGPEPPPRPISWRRPMLIGIGLLLLAATVLAIGRLLVAGAGGPIIFPISDEGEPAVPTLTLSSIPAPEIVIGSITGFDPFGSEGENDDDLAALIDGDSTTSWRTEVYSSQVTTSKPGVGFVVTVEGDPQHLQLVDLSEGSSFIISWADEPQDLPTSFQQVAAGRAHGGTVSLQLPPRSNGAWLVWFNELTERGEEEFATSLAEVRFAP